MAEASIVGMDIVLREVERIIKYKLYPAEPFSRATLVLLISPRCAEDANLSRVWSFAVRTLRGEKGFLVQRS